MNRLDPAPLAANGWFKGRPRGGRTSLLGAIALAFLTSSPAAAQDELLGAWSAERYIMADGAEHAVRGRIFFTARDWQVLFFVLDERGEVRRGSAEGGAYTLRGEHLVFSHLFNLSTGDEMEGLPAAELRMIARGPDGAPEEPTTVEVSGDGLTLYFPSGNRMTFRRR